jgi:mannose-6-phosphate isomerase-like protein (cupin superfamily)
MKKIAVVLAVLVSVGTLGAQAPQTPPVTPTKFVHYPATELKAYVAAVKSGGKPTFQRVNRGDHEFQSIGHRNKSSAPEMHANWADLYYFLDGEVTLHYGGKLEGAKETQAGSGEWRGGTIVGGTRQKLVAGDVASAPAGTPHQWEVENGKTVTYMTVKILKQPGH